MPQEGDCACGKCYPCKLLKLCVINLNHMEMSACSLQGSQEFKQSLLHIQNSNCNFICSDTKQTTENIAWLSPIHTISTHFPRLLLSYVTSQEQLASYLYSPWSDRQFTNAPSIIQYKVILFSLDPRVEGQFYANRLRNHTSTIGIGMRNQLATESVCSATTQSSRQITSTSQHQISTKISRARLRYSDTSELSWLILNASAQRLENSQDCG